ncbi:MAG TPA: DUF5060 domain-containing protein [Tepidisphaeraceae bacterium]|nr:DUF5060 domain-containing protein [Tepidisphaeraceae bacterium]
MKACRLLNCGFFLWIVGAAISAAASKIAPPATQPVVEQWGVFETALKGPSTGNPFVDVDLSARFTSAGQSVDVRGFYDGDGVYRIRFMPSSRGQWLYQTSSNCPQLSGQTGAFWCAAPSGINHGPVRVHNLYHFAYADGTPFVLIGTTCYAWTDQPDDLEDETLETLKHSPFDKVRMSLLPGKAKPIFYPYERDSSGKWREDRFNVDFFRHLEKRIQQLGQEGIQADLILFNPYHKGEMQWFDNLDDAGDDRYINYVVARLSAYQNIWWSLANEYGQVKGKTDADWDHFFQIVAADDPYGHLRSIHNAAKFYDPNKPWVTHASIQNGSAVADFGRAVLYRDLCRKPIVYDEVGYEGNIDRRWGDLSPEEMVKRFWLGTIAGTYVGHGETYSNPDGPTWTSQGGKLLGTSPPRLAFLRKILESGPADGIEPIDQYYHTHVGGKAGEYYLIYFGQEKPTQWTFSLPRDPPNKNALAKGMKFRVDLLDTWNMTITPVDRIFTIGQLVESDFPAEGNSTITLPGKPYMALRIQRVPAQVDPIRMDAVEQNDLNDKLPDGGLPPAVGVANIEVFRASRDAAEITDGKGWTYNHHVDMACWSGRLYVAWDNGQKDEDTWPAREVFSSSADGVTWTAPSELFPLGMSNPLRMYFFHTPNGHMLAIAARRVVRGKITNATEGGVIVRELFADHTLGPVYTLMLSGPSAGAPPFYRGAADKNFVAACDELLADHTFLEQQDQGALLGDQRMTPYDGAPSDFGKAFCFFRRPDGTLLGICKKAYVVVSRDSGATWTWPARLQSFKGGTAKEWIQRTADGRFAWAHDPFPTDRYPLAVLTSNDGITFRDMRAVHGEVPRQRCAGLDKNIGPQYVRGISFWNSDGSRKDAAMWLAYSVNKEDIWVSRIPLPIRAEASGPVEDRFADFPPGGIVAGWNTYSPKWASVTIAELGKGEPNCLRLEDHDPYDYALAARAFPIAAKVTATFELMATHSGGKTFEIELWSEFGDIRPVRIILQADGDIDAVTTKDRRVHVGNYAADHWMTFKIEADAFEKAFTLTLDGTTVATDLPLAENTASFQRLIFRTGEYRSLPIRGNEVPPGTDKPTASAEYFLRSVAIQTR